jgi:uncharacterized protein YqeY
MALEQTLNETLTQAIKAKDTRTADVVRMLKTKVQERRTAKGFAGDVDDALVLDVIGAYRKLLQKAVAEYDKLGERGAAQAAQLRFEIDFCERYLTRGCARWCGSASRRSGSPIPSRPGGWSATS